MPDYGFVAFGVENCNRSGEAISPPGKEKISMKQNAEGDCLKTDWSHIKLAYVIYYYLDQEDSSSLLDLLREYAGYPKEIIDHIHFVVVDDGSPVRVSIPENMNLNLTFLRIDRDIRWNQGGARNLGIVMAKADKIFTTDLDHRLPEHTLRELVGRKNPGRTIYKFQRLNEEGKDIGYHLNTLFFSRARFLRYYGLDEQFCGHYGYEDALFWRWQRYHGTRFLYLSDRFNCIHRSKLDLGKSYHSLHRDLTHNRQLAEKVKRDWKTYGAQTGHSRQFLCFPWQFVEERQRDAELPPLQPDRLWSRTWWWRWLVG
jgi:hypothetical protein